MPPKKFDPTVIPKPPGPDMTKFMDKRLILKVNADRQVGGTLRGFDDFMNLTLEDIREYNKDGQPISENLGTGVVRGTSIRMLESLDPVGVTNYAPKTR